jgi:thiamine-monophosphate kinase
MTISEFDIIERYFMRRGTARDDIVLGIGDDAALLQPPTARLLVSAVDTLVSGRHFPDNATAFDIGYKSLAVNLSDLAAMGAEPAWATLALTLPDIDTAWLQAFADGFFSLADQHRLALVGGDTTRGPLSVSVQVQGFVEPSRVLRRDAAEAGQAIYVSGTPGDAAFALQSLLRGDAVDPGLLKRLHQPTPRLALGRALGGVAAAAIDVSDGLLADLGHILEASGCGATLWPDRLPQSDALRSLAGAAALECQLNGGDDYELCFTVSPQQQAGLARVLGDLPVAVTEIGVVTAAPGIVCQPDNGVAYTPAVHGYDHFEKAGND